MDEFASQVSGVSALAEPARRALYLYVVAQTDAVGRDQAAEGCDLPRHTAKFHLDKLVEEGLLDVEYRRLSGRDGPGAGRPAKLYRRSDRQVEITLPQRHYELAGKILAEAAERAARDGEPILDAIDRAAAEAGRLLGTTAAREGSAPLDQVAAVLAAHGYEPRVTEGAATLANCPFHALARDHPALVCGMNLHLIAALLTELGHPGLRAELRPAPGHCCVTVHGTGR